MCLFTNLRRGLAVDKWQRQEMIRSSIVRAIELATADIAFSSEQIEAARVIFSYRNRLSGSILTSLSREFGIVQKQRQRKRIVK